MERLVHIADLGPRHATSHRARPRYHYVAATEITSQYLNRLPGQALCNPHLTPAPTPVPPGTEATCTRCRTRAQRYHVRVIPPAYTPDPDPVH